MEVELGTILQVVTLILALYSIRLLRSIFAEVKKVSNLTAQEGIKETLSALGNGGYHRVINGIIGNLYGKSPVPTPPAPSPPEDDVDQVIKTVRGCSNPLSDVVEKMNSRIDAKMDKSQQQIEEIVGVAKSLFSFITDPQKTKPE